MNTRPDEVLGGLKRQPPKVLPQPERINAYAQAVIRTLQEDEHQRGCLMEERGLRGDPAYESSMPRLAGDEERFVLLAMHQALVERGSPQPGRAEENSPAFQRWGSGREGASAVRDERTGPLFAWFLPPFQGLEIL